MNQPIVAFARPETLEASGSCPHRTVSKDGRIVCAKISQGDNTVSPASCRSCPYCAVNCAHLRFSLQQTSSSSLVVHFNGQTQVWNDGPAQLLFFHAACAERVLPIQSPKACADCPLRQPCAAQADRPAPRCAPARPGKVVSFPTRESLAATG